MTAIARRSLPADVVLSKAFLREVGAVDTDDWQPKVAGILAALRAELLMPLRALNECDLTKTMGGPWRPSPWRCASFATRLYGLFSCL